MTRIAIAKGASIFDARDINGWRNQWSPCVLATIQAGMTMIESYSKEANRTRGTDGVPRLLEEDAVVFAGAPSVPAAAARSGSS